MSTTAVAVAAGARRRMSVSPRDEVERIIRRAKFDYDEATEALLGAMKDSQSLRDYVQSEGARYLVRNITSNIRASCVRDTKAVAPGEPNRRHQSAIKSFLDEFPLPSGLPIGDARRADLKVAIEFYGAQEAGMRRARKFLESVGKKLPDGKSVREVFSDAQLKRMYREAR